MEKIFKEFNNLLSDRFNKNVFTTEDSVRYTFFAALLKNEISPENVILEYPHKHISGAEIDTWLPKYNGEADVAIEFKYDRNSSVDNNQPKTQKAGAVFRDLQRLALSVKDKEVRSYFVYVTSEEMAGYFKNKRNGVSELWNLECGNTLKINDAFFCNKTKTFLNQIVGSFEAEIACAFKSDLPDKNYLRIYYIYK
jgi:hypothetical protein